MRFKGQRVAALPSAEARQKILAVVRRVPKGCVASYGQIAYEAGLPGRARLVGRVLGECTDLKLPWHRILNAAGKVSLPKSSPSHTEQKRRLRGEGVVLTAAGVNMRRFQWQPRHASPLLD